MLEALWSARRRSPATRDNFRKKLRDGELDDKEIEVEVADTGGGAAELRDPRNAGRQIGVLNINDMISQGDAASAPRRARRPCKRSYALLISDESDKLLDKEEVVQEAIELDGERRHRLPRRDRQDRFASKAAWAPTCRREGVQRDLLPLIEGTTVATKYGPVKTDHILFIAQGAFHVAKPSDLLPELQGRLPIRVELRAL